MNIMSILGVYRPMFGAVTQLGLRLAQAGLLSPSAQPCVVGKD